MRRIHFGSILLLVLSMGFFSVRQHLELSVVWDKFVAVFVFPVMITTLFSAFISQWWPCPCCKNAFFIDWYGAIRFVQTCRHCGLEKWAEPGDDGQSADLSLTEVDEYWKRQADGKTLQ